MSLQRSPNYTENNSLNESDESFNDVNLRDGYGAHAIAISEPESETAGLACEGYIETAGSEQRIGKITKAEKKKARHEQILENRKLKRKDEKSRKRERVREERQEQGDTEVQTLSKRLELVMIRDRQREGMRTGQRVCVDLSMEDTMSFKEKSKLAQQLCRLYGVNRKCAEPAKLYFAGFCKDGELYKECVRKNSGFQDYMVEMTEMPVTELFPPGDIVYLTPDADEELKYLSPEKVYVLGGLVDESVNKNVTRRKADTHKISTAKLPITSYMDKVEQASHSQVLAINQVFEILMTFKSTGDWSKALSIGVPKRKGYRVTAAESLLNKSFGMEGFQSNSNKELAE